MEPTRIPETYVGKRNKRKGEDSEVERRILVEATAEDPFIFKDSKLEIN